MKNLLTLTAIHISTNALPNVNIQDSLQCTTEGTPPESWAKWPSHCLKGKKANSLDEYEMFEQTSSRCWIANNTWNNSWARSDRGKFMSYLSWKPSALNTRHEVRKCYSSIACVLRARQRCVYLFLFRFSRRPMLCKQTQCFHEQLDLTLSKKCRCPRETRRCSSYNLETDH